MRVHLADGTGDLVEAAPPAHGSGEQASPPAQSGEMATPPAPPPGAESALPIEAEAAAEANDSESLQAPAAADVEVEAEVADLDLQAEVEATVRQVAQQPGPAEANDAEAAVAQPPLEPEALLPSDPPGAATAPDPPALAEGEPEAGPTEAMPPPPSDPEPSPAPAAEILPRKPPGEMSAEEWLSDGNLAHDRGGLDEALRFYKKALGKLGTETTALRAEVYIRIADVMRAQGKPRVAISNYDKALAIEPGDLRALFGSTELNAEQGNWKQVHSGEQRYLELLDDPAREFDELMRSGVRWLDEAKDPRRAKERFEAARDRFDDRAEPLERLVAIYRAEGDEEQLLQTRLRLLGLLEAPDERADGYTELGEWCLFEAQRPDDAYRAFETALEAKPTRLDVLEMLASALAEQQEWAELERIYRKEIELLDKAELEHPTTHIVAELHHRLALLNRDHLGDAESALSAIDEALRLNPANLSGHLLAAEVSHELDQPLQAIGYLGRAARIEPERSETYHQMFQFATSAGDLEAAFVASSVTCVMGASTDEERIAFHKHRPDPVPQHQQALEPTALELLRCPDADATVEAVMQALAPSILRMRVEQLAADGKLPDLPEQARQDPETSTISVVRSLGWAGTLLQIETPAIFVSEDYSGTLLAPFARMPAVMAGRGTLRGRTLGELAFMAGRHLALRLPEHELVAHLGSIEELTACFLAALDIVLGTPPAGGEIGVAASALAKVLPGHQTDEEADALDEAVRRFESAGGRVSLTEWLGCVERFASRTGLVLCGDLETAVTLIRDETELALLEPAQRIEDLCAFAVSDQHLRLREALGCAIDPA